MNMITIDAHSRDMVANIVDAGEARPDCFLWMCQLRSYWDAALGDCRCAEPGRARRQVVRARCSLARPPSLQLPAAACLTLPSAVGRTAQPASPQDQGLRRVLPM
jgi:hypothetical protein